VSGQKVFGELLRRLAQNLEVSSHGIKRPLVVEKHLPVHPGGIALDLSHCGEHVLEQKVRFALRHR
jgi:ribosome maturation factor RimP